MHMKSRSATLALLATILGVAVVVAAAVSADTGAGDESAVTVSPVASASSEGGLNQPGSDDVAALVDRLDQRGLTVVESEPVLGSPNGIPAGIAITVVGMVSDGYTPMSVYSRVIHEASSDVLETQAAERVREYFVSGGSQRFGKMLEGLMTDGVTVTDDAGERTLTLDLSSDGSQEAAGSITLLARTAAVLGGWVSDLNGQSEGLGLTWVRIHVSYPDDTPDLFAVIDPARQAIDWRGGAPADIGHQPAQAAD